MGSDAKALEKLNSVLSTPIIWEDKCVGVLNLDSHGSASETGVNDPTIQSFFQGAAAHMAPALNVYVSQKSTH